jgi:hypothetical protein
MEGREWADEAHAALSQGRTVQVRPKGRLLSGRVNDGDLVTLEPCSSEQLPVGDIVLARVRDPLLVLHLILAVGPSGFLIGNVSGRADGWVSRHTRVPVGARTHGCKRDDAARIARLSKNSRFWAASRYSYPNCAPN